MAEEHKPTVELPDVPKHDAPAAEQTPAAAAAQAAQDKHAGDESKPASADASQGDKKDEVKAIDEGHLAHKAQGASFPKNLIPSKEFFFFGSDSFDPKSLLHYQKSEKSAETAHSNIAWASHTGIGLLFVGDKKNPTNVINLADASEPEVDGSNKFHFTAKGNKHSFKALSAAERDGWVAQLKLKIAEAKELATTVTESETYKNTVESFLKPAPVAAAAKEDKAGETAAKAEEPTKTEDTPKEGETAKDEPKEDSKTEDAKRRSASRKRTSFFGFGKKEEKKDDVKTEDAAANEAVEPAAEAEETVASDARANNAEERPAEGAAPAESPKDKPTPSKRNSFFGGVFSKKDKKVGEATKSAEGANEAPQEADAPVTDAAAPVIPPVESTTPLAVDVSNPATVPVEHVDLSAGNGESKKDSKEKRKSSLPFAFGKRDKSPTPADGEEKTGKSAFSKLRATIKGRAASKSEEKSTEEAAKNETATEGAARDAAAAEGSAKDATPAAEGAKAADAETENKPENVAAPAPAVTAAA